MSSAFTDAMDEYTKKNAELQAENERLKEIYKDVRKYIDNKTYDNAEKIAHIDILIDKVVGDE